MCFDTCENSDMLERLLGSFAGNTLLILLAIFPAISCIPVAFYVIFPYRIDLKRVLVSEMPVINYHVTRRGSLKPRLKQYEIHTDVLVLNYSTPQEILNVFCNNLFPEHVNTIMYIKSKQSSVDHSSRDFIMDISKYIGMPIISWDPDFPGALQKNDDSRVLQLAPTIYHQCKAMLGLLHRYNWTDFTVVTTTSTQELEFINSVDTLVKEHNSKRGITRETRLRILSTIVIDLPKGMSTEQKIISINHAFKTKKNKDNRVFLLHTKASDAKTLLEVATKLNITGKNYIWILTSISVGKINKRRIATKYPLGTLGIAFDLPEVEIERQAVKTALRVWAKALANLSGYVNDYRLSPNLSCNKSTRSTVNWEAGRRLHSSMKAVMNFENETFVKFSENGVNQMVKLRIINVQLDENRHQVWNEVGKWIPFVKYNRTEMIIQMKEITWPGGLTTPPKGKPDRRHFRIVTLKEDPYVMYQPLDNETNSCGHHSVVCRLVYDPKSHGNDSTLFNNTVKRCCTGLCIDLLTILSNRMGFNYELYEVPDQTWGVKNQNGTWNGLIQQILDDEADMVLTSLKITPKRNEDIDFSVPFLETGITIVVSIRKGAISPTAFLEPYDYPSWCLILVFSVHATGASIFIYEWLSPRGLDQGKTSMRGNCEHKFSLFRSLWLIWAMLFGASVSTNTPRGVSSRFLANVWALFALVFLASYTANLAAFMITKDEYYDLSGIKDQRLRNPFAHSPPFRFGTVPYGSTEENLRQNHPDMFSYMRQYNQSSVEKALRSLEDGEIHAFIYDATPLEYHAGNDEKCDLITVGEWYAMTGYGVGFPRGSPWVEEVDQIILNLQKTGEMERLRKFWLAGACHRRKEKRGQSSHNIGILNFTSAFIFLAGGMLIGVILLIAEHIYFKFGRTCLKKYDKHGCCALVSLSMGKSLTFEQSVMEAMDLHKRHRCKDPLCETQLWKVRHELDLSKFTIEKLKDQLQSYGIKPLEGNLFRHKKKTNTDPKPNGYPRCNRSHQLQHEETICPESQSKEHLLQESEQTTSCSLHVDDSSLSRWSKRSLRRSPSYTNAILTDTSAPDNSAIVQRHLNKVRCHDGKFYVGVSNENAEGFDVPHFVE